MQHETHFSLDEARALLPDLEPKVQELLELRHDLDAKGYDVVAGEFTRTPSEDEKREVEEFLKRIQELLDEIHSTGALYKDPRFELGTLDFPHIRDGEEVYLCWMHGEDDVKYWHPVEEGMQGRQPL